VRGIQISQNLARYCLVCLLLGGLFRSYTVAPALAAQEPAPTTGAIPKATGTDQSHPPDTSNVAPDEAVITINGLCDNPPTDKVAAPNCKTVITRAEFERLVGAVQPNMKLRAQREFATRYATALVMAKNAEQMGLDKGANFEEQMKVARIQVLSRELKKAIEREVSEISDTDVEDYYRANTPSFEEAEMERIYVPRTQDSTVPPDKMLSDTDKQKQLQRAEQMMRELANKLRTRAIEGENFSNLQAEAYKIAGIKTTASPSLGTIRRVSLPHSQVWVMDLKPGDVSSVIEAPNGYLIYKVKTKGTLPLEKAREEIKGVLRSKRLQEETQAIEEFATPTLNEVFFRTQRASQTVNKPVDRPEAQ
jgi:PPIC-type PPIASE domain